MKIHKLPSRSKPSRRAALATCILFASASVSLFAQEAEDDAVFTLSPFEVNAADDRGYRATNTLAGTRFDSSLKDTPASVSVFTMDFIQDAGLDTIREAIDYSMAFNIDNRPDNGNHEQFGPGDISARGFPPSQGTSRDFFRSETTTDRYNVERMEFSRGPNSILFGIGNPGGIVNAITKRARVERDFGQFEAQFDEFGTQRYSLDVNRVLVEGKFGLRLNLLHSEKESYRDNDFDRTDRAHIAATFKPHENTTIRADYERGFTDRVKQRRWVARDGVSQWIEAGSVPLDFDDFLNDDGSYDFGGARSFIRDNGGDVVTSDRITVIDDGQSRTTVNRKYSARSRPNRDDVLTTFDVWDFERGLSGVANTSDHDYYNYSVFLEQKIGDRFYVELAFKDEKEDRDVVTNINHGDIEPAIDIAQRLPDGSPNPHFGEYYLESRPMWQPFFKQFTTARATVSYELDFEKKWMGRHLFAALYQEEDNDQQFNRYFLSNRTPLNPSNNRVSQNRIYGVTYISPDRSSGASSGFAFDPFNEAMVAPFEVRDPVTNEVIGTVSPDWVKDRERPGAVETTSKMIAGQSFFFDDTLVFTWGFRKDELAQRNFTEQKADNAYVAANPGTLRDEILSSGLTDPAFFDGDTRSVGVVYKPLDWVSFTANQSENFRPQTRFNIFNENIGNVIADGKDYSVRFDAFEQKVYLVASYYETEVQNEGSNNFSTINRTNDIWRTLQVNNIVSDPEFIIENGVKGRSFTGDGIELELVSNPIPNITLRANFTDRDNTVTDVNPFVTQYLEENISFWRQHGDLFIDGSVTDTINDRIDQMIESNEDDKLQLGSLPDNFIESRASFFGKYEFFDGPLEGFDAGIGVRHLGKRKTGIVNGVLDFSDSYEIVDLKFGYKFTLKNDNRVNLRLNIKNAFDQGLITVTRKRSSGEIRSFELIDPRSVSLTATLGF